MTLVDFASNFLYSSSPFSSSLLFPPPPSSSHSPLWWTAGNEMSVSHSSTDQDHPETSTHPPTDTHAGKRQMHCHGSLNIRLPCQDPDIHIDTHTVGEWYQSDGKGLLRLDGRNPIHSTGCLLTPCGSTWTQPPRQDQAGRTMGGLRRPLLYAGAWDGSTREDGTQVVRMCV